MISPEKVTSVLPGRPRRWAVPAGIAILAYGAVRLLAPLGTAESRHLDLFVVPRWAVASLCLAAALLAFAFTRPGAAHRIAVAGGWVVSAALTMLGSVLVLDVVALALPGIGIHFHWPPFLLRLGCVLSGLLLALLTRESHRELRGACRSCGRAGGVSRWATRPGWALAAGYLAVAGCAVRFGAQLLWEDPLPITAGFSAWVFLVGMALGGTLLPLALVHTWGEIWPDWVLPLAGRRVPRLLLLVPATVFALGLVSYFGVFGLVQLVLSTFNGTPVEQELFLWLAVGGYLAWGAGIGFAALAYRSRTLAPCLTCGPQPLHYGRSQTAQPRRVR